MKQKLIFSILICATLSVKSQTNYQVAQIPKELLTRASAVVRNMELNINVKDLDDVTYRYKIATTILNKNGDDEGGLYIWYNKSQQIKSVKGVVYDKFSIPVGKISEKDFKDVSTANGFSLFEDSRAKIFRPAVTVYPYTVVYEYEIHAKQSMVFPDWFPKHSSDVSVENATLQFSSKPNFSIRYRENRYTGDSVKIYKSGDFTTYIWKAKNLEASRYEPYSPSPEEILTSVRIAPNTFKYMGVTGSFTNWNEMGNWMNDKLLKDRNTIPEATANYIRELTLNISDPKLKAKKIYEYMQQKTRYVGVQIGIGGYQPFKAEDVDRTSYGDCKGLANYTQGLLKVAGIDSYYAVIYGDDYKHNALLDFASMDQFNHVILCIPFKNDTTWVDCTNKENPFGYLGDFTDDRLALICTKSGGKLIRTPKFTDEQSLQNRIATFEIDAEGNLSGNIVTTFTGSQYDNRSSIVNEPLAEQLKKFSDFYSIDNAEIQSFKITQDKSIHPVTTETITLKARNYASINGKQLYLPLNMMNRQSPQKEISNRTSAVKINRGYVDVDVTTFILPQGFKIDFKPDNHNIESTCGTYRSTVEQKGEIIKYTRKMKLKEGVYPADKYQDLVNLYQSAYEADNEKLILVAQ
ncbi:MAG: hypothetical protein JWN56_2089 [Sphingobacteriales bacterium]|nr:hypothetical protein [Sphingobacteriales bacterium]